MKIAFNGIEYMAPEEQMRGKKAHCL